jgi:aminotransferase
MLSEYDMRRRLIVSGFNKIGMTCFEPKGAFYCFPSIKISGMTSEEFCEKLLYEKKVAVVPGNAFGDCGEGFIRVSYCYSTDHIKEALRRIGEFLSELENK